MIMTKIVATGSVRVSSRFLSYLLRNSCKRNQSGSLFWWHQAEQPHRLTTKSSTCLILGKTRAGAAAFRSARNQTLPSLIRCRLVQSKRFYKGESLTFSAGLPFSGIFLLMTEGL